MYESDRKIMNESGHQMYESDRKMIIYKLDKKGHHEEDSYNLKLEVLDIIKRFIKRKCQINQII